MSDPLELDKQAGLPYVPGWSTPRNMEEALAEVQKLREHYAAKCINLDQALRELTSVNGQLVELATTKAVMRRQRDDLSAHVQRLVVRVNKYAKADPVAAQAHEYLMRHGLVGSMLRKGDDNGN